MIRALFSIIIQVTSIIHVIIMSELLLSLAIRLNLVKENKYLRHALVFMNWILEPVYMLVCKIFPIPYEFAQIITIISIILLQIVLSLFI